MKLVPCGCGKALIKTSTQMCGACRKRLRARDMEMVKAAAAQTWLSKPWGRPKKRK